MSGCCWFELLYAFKHVCLKRAMYKYLNAATTVRPDPVCMYTCRPSTMFTLGFYSPLSHSLLLGCFFVCFALTDSNWQMCCLIFLLTFVLPLSLSSFLKSTHMRLCLHRNEQMEVKPADFSQTPWVVFCCVCVQWQLHRCTFTCSNILIGRQGLVKDMLKGTARAELYVCPCVNLSLMPEGANTLKLMRNGWTHISSRKERHFQSSC